jgi:hypothetical protein
MMEVANSVLDKIKKSFIEISILKFRGQKICALPVVLKETIPIILNGHISEIKIFILLAILLNF